ncbi:5-methyltetrahydropteroyltriglutamate--homocysteine methyltransferase [Roseovarius faecimaris]|uniref:5-methyltetrahydropteroyltriglutamate--homocysteine methyltransferase n=1 Tax=Roseovarius faecimaris TaxID=2494550 RepID=A0A6I6IPE1_9RHOB|nr:cobalamin-independent methionine synthase II family protein [Roseovarius faecimaris]QGX97994.1 5-methyltetrahydropteroyltriglutamate--homocysteine methyltransferase [Roseovarius faecimaris]
MPLKTTCIGAYPKPDYLPIQDWFQVHYDAEDYNERVTQGWTREKMRAAQDLFDRATAEAVADQIACGVDIPTDGEQRRENYVHYQCRHFTGFDFENLTRAVMRNGAYTVDLPTIRGKITGQDNSTLVRDWQVAEAAAGRPVKITLPGPMTIADTTADAFYDDDAALARDLSDALNGQVRALAEAGCRFIQVDEPIFARKPDQALAYGIETLERCFHGVPGEVTRVVHMCCGYPNNLDDDDYPKADQQAYAQIAEAVDGVTDQISIEDAHRYNPGDLFERFKTSQLIVGFVTVASSRVEPVEEIRTRMQEILQHIPAERLLAAPDCGLGFLGRELAMTKLRNLSTAARSV